MGNSGGKGGLAPPPGGDPNELNVASEEVAGMFTTAFNKDSAAKFLFSEEYDVRAGNDNPSDGSFTSSAVDCKSSAGVSLGSNSHPYMLHFTADRSTPCFSLYMSMSS